MGGSRYQYSMEPKETHETMATLLDAAKALTALGAERLSEFKPLLADVAQYISYRDMVTLFFGPLLGASMLKGVVTGQAFRNDTCDPDDLNPEMLAAVLRLARWLSQHYFATTIHNVDNLPADRPALIVANHSAGLMPLDALFAIDAVTAAQGPERRIYSLVHDFAYMSSRIARLSRSMGVIRAKKENALRALSLGHHVLVYPGGDQEAFRKFSDRKKIVLAGRKGFVRVAMEAGVPIVPMVSVGLHESFFVVTRGERVAEKLGLKALIRTDLFPLALSLPWGIAPAFFPFIPLPAAIDIEFCAPIVPAGAPDDEEAVLETYRNVEDAMQAAVDKHYAHRSPFLGR